VGLASAVGYMQNLLNGMNWPAQMQALPSPPPPLACYITPPDPNVLAGTPSAYVWFNRGDEARNGAKYGAGTVPRASYPGGPSGTKTIEHTIPVYVVWTGGSPTDPNVNILFPGMVDAIMATLRVSPDPALVTDPWTGEQTQLVDIGERIAYLTSLRALEPMQAQRLDALLEITATEVLSS
jgi:hypothetical protein